MGNIDRKTAVATLWKRGVLHWKLDPVQKELYNSFQNSKDKVNIWLAARRTGKSYALCVIALELCFKTPNVIVKYIAPKQKDVKMIIHPLIRKLLEDCPRELRPKFHTSDGMYKFHNGSEIHMAGTDNERADSLRGGTSHLCIVDEAGFCDDLFYVVSSVLIPTTTTTGGKIILSSTLPKTVDHPFITYVNTAKADGKLINKTIDDNARLTETERMDIINSYPGGTADPNFRREYMNILIKDEDSAIVPEFDNEELRAKIVREWERPPFYDAYTAADIGSRDFTVVLFGYYDFRSNKLVIEDEGVLKGKDVRTDKFADLVKTKEQSLWIDKFTGESKEPYLRVCDSNLVFINDLQNKPYNLQFLPAKKDEATAALNDMRTAIARQEIVINPRCRTLLTHLENGVWNKAKNSYARSDEMGHYDAIDALKYFYRHIHKYKNPYPSESLGENVFVYKQENTDNSYDRLASIFKMKRS